MLTINIFILLFSNFLMGRLVKEYFVYIKSEKSYLIESIIGIENKDGFTGIIIKYNEV